MIDSLIRFCEDSEFHFISEMMNNDEHMIQFILDPTSMNLPSRVNISDDKLPQLLNICRNLVNSLHTERIRKLKEKQNMK